MTKEELEKENTKLKDEIHTWKEASSANSYKAFQLQEETKTLSKHILELKKEKGELTDKCRKLETQIKEMKGTLLCLCEGCSRLPKLYEKFNKVE